MKAKILLILIAFTISIFATACGNDTKLDVKSYREGLKSSQKKSMPMEQKKAIEKSLFPNINQK